jgi:hypothetical protein
MEEADIRVSGLGVGKVRLDVAKIRGEGGRTRSSIGHPNRHRALSTATGTPNLPRSFIGISALRPTYRPQHTVFIKSKL